MNRKAGLILLVMLFSCFLVLNAEKSLERIANETGVEGETLFNEGKYLESAQKFESAISLLEEAVEKDGIPIDTEKINRWLELAFNGYFNGQDYENALKIQDERIQNDTSNYKLINYKAIILKKHMGRIEDAIDVLKIYNDKKRSFKVEKKIAGHYLELNDNTNALIWYEKAYELKKDSGVIKNIATLYLNKNENAKAVQAYEDFLLTDPPESVLAKTFKNMGALYEGLKNYSKSNLYYEKSLGLKYDKNLNLKLIINYYDSDNFTKAKDKISQRLSKKSNDADAIYYRAMVKINEGDKPGAKGDFQKLLGGKYKKSAQDWIKSIESEE